MLDPNPIYDTAGLRDRECQLQDVCDRISNLDLTALMMTDGVAPDENLRGVQEDLRRVAVATMDAFAKTITARYILHGVAPDVAKQEAWEDVATSLATYARKKKEAKS